MRSHINLIARGVLFEKPPLPFRQMAVPGAVLLALGLLIFFTLLYGWQARGLKKEIGQLTLQRDKVQTELVRINAEIGNLAGPTEADRNIEAQQLAAVRKLLENRILWSEVIQEVSLIVPEGVWLTRMESVDSKQGGFFLSQTEKAVRFVGMGQTQTHINRFISLLERSPRYGSVYLVFAQKGGDDQQRVNFELMAGLL